MIDVLTEDEMYENYYNHVFNWIEKEGLESINKLQNYYEHESLELFVQVALKRNRIKTVQNILNYVGIKDGSLKERIVLFQLLYKDDKHEF